LFLRWNSSFDSRSSLVDASLQAPGRTGPFSTQAILSPAGRWILPGGLFSPVDAELIKRAVELEAADGFD
jgi:hypothetical protein